MMENNSRNRKTFILLSLVSFLFCVPALAWNGIDDHTPPTIVIKPPDLTKSALPDVKLPKVDEKLLKVSAKPKMRPLIYHPSPMVRTLEAAKAIAEMYTSTATTIEETLLNDLEKLKKQKAFYWASEEEKKRKMQDILQAKRKISEIGKGARDEAPSRAKSWEPTPGWRDHPITIQKGPAFRQLESISVSGW
jgi:hypothetical protein